MKLLKIIILFSISLTFASCDLAYFDCKREMKKVTETVGEMIAQQTLVIPKLPKSARKNDSHIQITKQRRWAWDQSSKLALPGSAAPSGLHGP